MDLSFYYDLICKQPLLTKEQEYKLLETYHSVDSTPKEKTKARDVLIHSNLRFAFKRAKILSRGNVDQFEELISAGNEGLLAAIDKFKPSKDVRFLTYAGWWVRQRQFKLMAGMRLVAVPIWKQQLASRIMKAVESFEEPPSIAQLQSVLPDVPEKYLRELSGTRYLTFFMEDMHEDEVIQHSFVDELVEDIDEELLKRKMNKILTPEELRIISDNFGLDDGIDLPLIKIAENMNLSKDDTRNLRRSAINKLRKEFLTKN